MKSRKNVILIVGNSDTGFYKFRRELLTALREEKKEVFLAFPPGAGPFKKKLREMGGQIINLPINRRGANPFQELVLLLRLFRILCLVRPEAVLTYTIKPNIYVNFLCRVLGIPSVANITGLGSAVEHKGILGMVTVWMYRIALKRVDCVFFQNQQNMQFFSEHQIYSGRKELIPGSGVNLEEFSLLPYPEKGETEFLFEGRIMKEKGIEQFLDVAEAIKREFPESHFTIIGTLDEEGYREKIEMLEKKGIVAFDGPQEDTRPYLRRCSCVIHPSYYPEGMSNVLLEAAASGRAVITTGRSGCQEIVDDRKSGLIARERDSADFIEKTKAFLRLTREEQMEMGRRGRKKAEKEFDRKIVIEKYREVLWSITGERAAGGKDGAARPGIFKQRKRGRK